MKSIPIVSILGLILSISAYGGGAKKHSNLVPPPGSTADSRRQDIDNCFSQAKADIAFGKPPVDEKAKEPLQGHRTEGFVREGRTVVDRHFVPTTSKSLFVGSNLYGPANLSDRYVLCLLGRGYKWQETSKDQQRRGLSSAPKK